MNCSANTFTILKAYLKKKYFWDMQIKLIAIGKTDSSELERLISVYQNRLAHYVRFSFEVIPDLKNTKSFSEKLQKEEEGKLILSKIMPTDRLILLDENGKEMNSIGFSNFLQKQMNSGLKQLVFVIGGPYGFSEAVYKKAVGTLSLSKMTFSHQMVRLFVIEQLYRGFTILKNEPYHHR
jgi:23S rRNA (pseudouridine1915-N3)-methyltransferase